MNASDQLGDLLTALEHAGSGLAILELAHDLGLVAPSVSGVATLLPLSGGIYLWRDDAPPQRIKVGELALVPVGSRIALTAGRSAAKAIDSRARLSQRGGWIVAAARAGEPPQAIVAAARILGSRTTALTAVTILTVGQCPAAAPLFAQLVAEVGRGAAGHAGLGMALMNACVVHAMREVAGERSSADRTSRGAGVARAVAAIRAQPQQEHSVDALAAVAGMSRSSFVRGFNQATGTAPQRFLQQVRLEEASALLQSTSLPVKAIAAMTGFRSRSHFSRSFREVFAVDPSRYRRDLLDAAVP